MPDSLSGAAWAAFGARPAVYAGIVVVGFAAAVAIAGIFEVELSGSFKYMLPLAIIVFGICGALTPLFERFLTEQRLQMGGSAVGLAASLAIGMALAGQGDNEAKHLSFPGARATPIATETVVAGITPEETTATPSSSGSPATAADLEGVTYVVVPDESTVQYTVREKLASFATESDAQGATSNVTGEVHLDGQQSTFTFDASTFTSDQDRRDNYIRDRIFNTDPTVTFVVDDLSGLPESYPSGETVTLDVTGTATIRGVSQPLTFSVEGRFDGDELQLLGNTSFTWADFNIEPPNTPLVTVTDTVNIEVLIIARPS